MIEILDTQQQIDSTPFLDCRQQGRVRIGPIIEKRTRIKRDDPRVISRFVAYQEPCVEAQFQKPLQNRHRNALGPTPLVGGIKR
jgi:hypothetical protein